MLQSLRGRLLIGVVSLVVVGLLISDVVTYLSLQSFLLNSTHDQLHGGDNTTISALGGPNESGPGPQSSGGLPEGTVVERVSADGTVLLARILQFGQPGGSKKLPLLPQVLPNASETTPAITTLAGTGGVSKYRASIWHEDLFQGDY